jgi:hypothetical protein
MPDPDERGRAYEAMRAHVSAETAEWSEQVPESGQRPDRTDQRSYRHDVPRFLDTGADQAERSPADRQQAADRAADPPGSYRNDAGPYRSSEQHAETAEAVGWMREAELTISADARTIERENKYGGWLEGFEFRLKGDDRLKEKVAEKLRVQPDREAAEIIREIPDAIRYTFCLRPETYTAGYYDIKQQLEEQGYEMYYSKNWWTDPEYKGINTRWVTAEEQRFEVQFHTPDSFHAKQHVTHTAYERIRDRLTSDAERAELKSFQREVSSRIEVPDGAPDIPDYEKKGF